MTRSPLITLLLVIGCSSPARDGSPDDGGDGDSSSSGGHETGDGSGGASGGTAAATGGTGGAGTSATSWPDNRLAAITLSYDDGLDSQLKYAVPALDARGLTGTFFLASFQGVDHNWSLPNLSDPLTPRHEAWVATLVAGHELAAHTIYHPCESNNPGYQPADYDMARMADELDESSERLERLGATLPLSFAYPCAGDTVGIGQGESYAPLIHERYVAARVSTIGVTDPSASDLFEVAQKFGDAAGSSAAELIAYVDEAISKGAWAVFTFHGIGPEQQCNIDEFALDVCALSYLTTQTSEHDALLDYLVEKQNEVWVAPMKQVAKHLASSR